MECTVDHLSHKGGQRCLEWSQQLRVLSFFIHSTPLPSDLSHCNFSIKRFRYNFDWKHRVESHNATHQWNGLVLAQQDFSNFYSLASTLKICTGCVLEYLQEQSCWGYRTRSRIVGAAVGCPPLTWVLTFCFKNRRTFSMSTTLSVWKILLFTEQKVEIETIGKDRIDD